MPRLTVQYRTIRGKTMQYYARMTIRSYRSYHTDDNGKARENFLFVYLPAFDRSDAEEIVNGLNKGGVPHHVQNGQRISRIYDVVASVYTGKGNVYLSVETLEQIADEYTRPAIAAE